MPAEAVLVAAECGVASADVAEPTGGGLPAPQPAAHTASAVAAARTPSLRRVTTVCNVLTPWWVAQMSDEWMRCPALGMRESRRRVAATTCVFPL